MLALVFKQDGSSNMVVNGITVGTTYYVVVFHHPSNRVWVCVKNAKTKATLGNMAYLATLGLASNTTAYIGRAVEGGNYFYGSIEAFRITTGVYRFGSSTSWTNPDDVFVPSKMWAVE